MAASRSVGHFGIWLTGKAGLVGVAAAGIAGITLCSVMVLRTSQAMFVGTTDNPSNSWATGTVVLADNDSGTALFSTGTDGSLTGGQVLTKCLIVTYNGTLVSSSSVHPSVKLYGTASGLLAPYLTLAIDQGTGGGSAGSCTGWSATSAGVYTGDLAGFATNVSAFASGVGAWLPASTGETMTYRFTVTVQSVAGAQGQSASASFTWEARA